MITAKVQCQTKTPAGEGQFQVTFVPDYADGRNSDWALYTPSLSLSMTLKGDVAERFEQGRAYTLQFVESE